jgi:hypothetical protein
VDGDGQRFSPVARSFSQTAGTELGIHFEKVCVREAAGSRFRVAKNVSVLRFNHVPVEDIVSGVREVARSGHTKIDKIYR